VVAKKTNTTEEDLANCYRKVRLDKGSPIMDSEAELQTNRTKWEIAIVLLLSYGMSAVYSVVNIIDRISQPTPLSEQTATLNRSFSAQEFFDLVYQLLGIASGLIPVLLVLWLVSNGNGGRFESIGLTAGGAKTQSKQLGFGLLIAAAIGIPGIGVYLAGRELGFGVQVVATSLTEHWWTVPVLILWALRAGIGEEVIIVGYLFNRLKTIGWTPWAIIISASVLRGSYHLYQGFGAFAGNIAMGIVFGLIYRRTGKLLPLIAAHTIIDTVAFVGYPLAVSLWPALFA